MSIPDFSTAEDINKMAAEVSCLKAIVTQMLKSIGQADAGKVIINMEKQISCMGNSEKAEIFSTVVNQIKQAYRQ